MYKKFQKSFKDKKCGCEADLLRWSKVKRNIYKLSLLNQYELKSDSWSFVISTIYFYTNLCHIKKCYNSSFVAAVGDA